MKDKNYEIYKKLIRLEDILRGIAISMLMIGIIPLAIIGCCLDNGVINPFIGISIMIFWAIFMLIFFGFASEISEQSEEYYKNSEHYKKLQEEWAKEEQLAKEKQAEKLINVYDTLNSNLTKEEKIEIISKNLKK